MASPMPLRPRHVLPLLPALLVAACAGASPAPPAPPCFTITGDSELRAKDATKTLDVLEQHIRLSPEDEALRNPRSLADIRTILRRDTVYLFGNAAAFARTLNTVEGRFSEAYLELLMGESQLVASQVLTTQAAWVGADMRIARATLASERGEPTTDRARMLGQLIRVVEEGNKVADALGAVAPSHLARGAEVIRGLRTEAPADARTFVLVAEYHRLRGEWTEFDAAMAAAEGADRVSPALRYLRGMEQLERFRRPDLGAGMLRESLKAYPRFVRAQAALVLMATNPVMALRELSKLKQMNEDHYLVALLEPTLAAEQELGRMHAGGFGPGGARGPDAGSAGGGADGAH
jgi:hypothetical protein